LAGQKRRQLTAKLMDLRFDAKDDDVFQQDHKKSHKKAKVEHQVRPVPPTTTNIVVRPPRSSRLHTMWCSSCQSRHRNAPSASTAGSRLARTSTHTTPQHLAVGAHTSRLVL
jgi:hypothetical protein